MNALKRNPVSVLLALGLLPLLIWVLDWALLSATFTPDLSQCRAVGDSGACWGVIGQKWKVILFGRYPSEAIWRPALFSTVWTLLLFVSFVRVLSIQTKLALWVILGGASLGLLLGGFAGLATVPTSLWGGLPLTLLVSILGMVLAFPLGILLALGRQHGSGLIQWMCTAYIETLRALPLIAVLFLAAFVLPLFLPAGGGDLLVRVVITIALFAAAYLAEVIRGGLQSLSQGQTMAARALGLSFAQTQVFVVLPQAVRACLPSLINSFVTLFKECSLIS
ncbi:MAG: amino acid ABC transporter permease, partial [Limnobacter sp.]|nr:amino acid ABC transporter permease [Limnobacter sp.]